MSFNDIIKKTIFILGTIAVTVFIVYIAANVRIGNKRIVDINYSYDRAMIRMPDGNIMDIEISDWTDYEGEQLQVVDKAGNVFLVSSYNCVLVRSGK